MAPSRNVRRACREVSFNAMPQFQMDPSLPPGLYAVATPIGNLGDMTPRAAETLRRADYILAEDKRVTAKLLAHIGAKAPMTPISRPQRREAARTDPGRSRHEGRCAGQRCWNAADIRPRLQAGPRRSKGGHAVHTGSCAAIAALTLAGLPTDRFLFLGFLPAKAKARADAISEVAQVRATLILYESGPRLGESLAALRDGLGDRDAATVREISKLHEETVSGTLHELSARYADSPPKGEIVIVVGPPPEREAASDAELDEALHEALAEMSPSRAAADVAVRLGIPRKRAYARALELGAATEAAAAEARGRKAEILAAWWLRLHGWRILAQRVRVPGGEVDLVPGAAECWRLSRSSSVRPRKPRIGRSTNIGCAGSQWRPNVSRPATPAMATMSGSMQCSSFLAVFPATCRTSGTGDKPAASNRRHP